MQIVDKGFVIQLPKFPYCPSDTVHLPKQGLPIPGPVGHVLGGDILDPKFLQSPVGLLSRFYFLLAFFVLQNISQVIRGEVENRIGLQRHM